MIKAELVVSSPNAEVFLSSLRPEVGREFSRTCTEVSGSNGTMSVSITADDTTAMRAALNSCLECIKVIESIDKITKVKNE